MGNEYIRNEKYYYSFPDYCKKTFGRKLYRIALDINSTCPNRDGSIGEGGCIFCSNAGSGDFSINYIDILERGNDLDINTIPYLAKTSGKLGDYIAYFQSYTNTYGDIKKLSKIYEAAMEDPLFTGISIGTRPDCLGDEVLKMLKDLRKKYPNKFIWVELGLQTIHEETARFIRRGYSLNVFDESVYKLHELGIQIISHVIIGLKGESEEMIYETINHLNQMKVDGVKLQLLHYLKDTDLGKMFLDKRKSGDLSLMPLDKDSYISILIGCIGRLLPDIVIHRLTGDGDRERLIEPRWSLNKKNILNEIRSEMKKRGIIQGSLF